MYMYSLLRTCTLYIVQYNFANQINICLFVTRVTQTYCTCTKPYSIKHIHMYCTCTLTNKLRNDWLSQIQCTMCHEYTHTHTHTHTHKCQCMVYVMATTKTK